MLNFVIAIVVAMMAGYYTFMHYDDLLVMLGAERAPRACTMDAKLCPDGSAVGRTGPNCEFAECPGSNW